MEKRCQKCGRIIIQMDWAEYIRNFPQETEIQCPYCGDIEEIKC